MLSAGCSEPSTEKELGSYTHVSWEASGAISTSLGTLFRFCILKIIGTHCQFENWCMSSTKRTGEELPRGLFTASDHNEHRKIYQCGKNAKRTATSRWTGLNEQWKVSEAKTVHFLITDAHCPLSQSLTFFFRLFPVRVGSLLLQLPRGPQWLQNSGEILRDSVNRVWHMHLDLSSPWERTPLGQPPRGHSGIMRAVLKGNRLLLCSVVTIFQHHILLTRLTSLCSWILLMFILLFSSVGHTDP